MSIQLTLFVYLLLKPNKTHMDQFTLYAMLTHHKINPITQEVISPTPHLIDKFNEEFTTYKLTNQ